MWRGRLVLVTLVVAFAVAAVSLPARGSALGSSKIKIGPNIDISNEPAAQFETSVAINPNNPSQIVAGSNDRSTATGPGINGTARAYFSSDGGSSWGSTPVPKPALLQSSSFITTGDSGLAWDTRSNVYFSHVVIFYGGSGAIVGGEIGVGKSLDGGRTWTVSYLGFAKGSAQGADKPMIAVDTNAASPFRDTIYVAWATNEGPPGLLVSHSSDFGATFSTPVSPTGQPPAGGDSGGGFPPDFSPDPFVGSDGTLYVAWQDQIEGRIAVASSTDGGQTFGPVTTIGSSPQAISVSIPAENNRTAAIYPACGADTSNGPRRGTLYCSWTDTTPLNGTDVFEAHSPGRGQTWSAPVRVNDDPPGVANDQFSQWLSVDPTDGSLSMIWDDTRNDPTHLSTDIFYARSTDGGLSFSPNVQVTTAPTNLTCCSADRAQYGEYGGIAAFGGVVHPVWTDMRASVSTLQQEIFTTTITIKSP